MNYQKLTKSYMVSVLIAGSIAIGWALANVPPARVDLYFFVLFCFTIGIGSRITIKIPRFKSHIAVSDTFVFIALLLFGGELAIILAAIEAAFSSWRFCSKKITVFFNAAVMALSTAAAVLALNLFGLYNESQLRGSDGRIQDFVIVLSVIALTQFVVNTTLASMHDSLKNGIPILDIWKKNYLWSFVTYFVGSVSAGILVLLSDSIGFGVIIAIFPVILLVFMSYRMYLTNIEMSMRQTEQAEHHASVLEERSKALQESEQRFRRAFTYAPIGIALVSPAGHWLKVNRALSNILGYTEDEFLEKDFQSMIFKDDLGITLVKIHELLVGKTSNCQMEQRYVHKDGNTVWASWSVSSASEVRSETSNLIFQIQDITDRKLAEEKLQHEATHDALTGLPNRSFFMTRLREALGNARSDPGYKVSVLFIDLDRFKYVNDSLGHLVGDKLLIGISERLSECMRPTDIVARLGGDEFTILVQGRYDINEVTNIADRIQRKFRMPFDLSGNEVYSSASIGILHASDEHLSSEDMMRDADTAMYQAKRAGRSRHEIFDEKMRKAAMETLQLETDLRKAVENNEFEVFYQPIFSLLTDKIEAVEALARWLHPVYGEVCPEKFIPLAEELGLIDQLGEQILRNACTQFGSITEIFESDSRIRLSVNLSCQQFAQAGLVEGIRNILKETAFPAASLKLEITESVFFAFQERAVKMLHELRQLGIDIDIDDFGTGYSNLSYLVRLPISSLKIDRSFVSPITEDGANTEIVKTILAMARNLGVKVVAEGVETPAQLEALRKLECEAAQGYLFAKPMNFQDIRNYLRSCSSIPIPKVPFDSVSVLSTLQ